MRGFLTTIASLAAVAAILGGANQAFAAEKTVTFAYQDMMTPIRVLMESGKLEQETHTEIKWVKFGGGGDVIRALASGGVDVGEAGSSPIAAAASQGLPIKLFWILDDIANAEQLVARNGSGINSIADLKGKTVATPFVSTSHYQLMFALKEAGLSPQDVKLVNLRPQEIAAAWERGDIDATFVWAPTLDIAKKTGKVIASAGDFAAKGKATFDGIVVTDSFAAENRDFLVTFVKLLSEADADYRRNAAKWTPDSAEVKAVAKWTGAKPEDVPAGIAAYRFLDLNQQASKDWLGGGAAGALKSTAEFLKDQGRVQALAPDYSRFVTADYVKAALSN
ncbi:taurine ABC transporter substrate-binding protein [Rhizobium paknamense]|uniref:Taurine transport system substrate-binding protein n=1 Tax=Rhizobium paknamense TaxID=1206817 RepID=A0ABU0IHR1_9HYPH|nr:taurine ABC transporter substrate-binding protein [Rhizobium paknamense]MDQ0457802.1 taurine transport system substrate-binding protein [Rhizobium paknamense]